VQCLRIVGLKGTLRRFPEKEDRWRADGKLVVTDGSDASAHLFAADGRLRKVLGRKGSGPGKFQIPHAPETRVAAVVCAPGAHGGRRRSSIFGYEKAMAPTEGPRWHTPRRWSRGMKPGPASPESRSFGRAQAVVWNRVTRGALPQSVFKNPPLRIQADRRSTSAVIPRPGHAVACFHTRGCRAEESTLGLLEGRRGSPCLLRGYDTGGQGQCRSGAAGHQQQTVDFSVGAPDFVRSDGAVWRLLRNDIRARAQGILKHTLSLRGCC
jgi:hypothetical protein